MTADMHVSQELRLDGPVLAIVTGGSGDAAVVAHAAEAAALPGAGRLALIGQGALPSIPPGLPQEVRVERRQVPADAAGAALADAERGQAGLVVASNASASARRLVRRAACPLLLVPAGPRPGDGPVLVPVDFSADALRAARFAAGFRQPVELIHVYGVPVGWHRLGWSYAEFVARMDARCRRDMDAFVASLDLPPAAARVELGGDVGATLLAAIRFRPASAVVLASPRRTFAASLVRGTAETVALNSVAPVWILRDAAEATFLDVLG